jgi:NDP-sugar pyrophosphorylase family protein
MIDSAVILVDGAGARVCGNQPRVPLPLVPVAGRPFLAWQLDWIGTHGIRQVVLTMNTRGDTRGDAHGARIREFFGTCYQGISLIYHEAAGPLGTGGALAAGLRALEPRHPVLALNGGAIAPLCLALLERHWTPHHIVLGLVDSPHPHTAPPVCMDGEQITDFGRGASRLASAGIYLAGPGALASVPAACSLERHCFPRLARHGGLRGAWLGSWMLDIGCADDYARARHLLPLSHGRPAGVGTALERYQAERNQ